MKKLIYILSVCATIGAIILILELNKRSTAKKTKMISDISNAVAVKIMAVSDSTYSVEFTSNGLLEALQDLPFVSDVAGRIVNIYADEGDYVSSGKVLVQLDSEMLRADVASSEASFESLKKDYERYKSSNAQGGVTDQQLDNIRTQMIAAESRLITGKRRLADASIKAPIAGKIYRRYVEVGSYLNPGAKLFDIIDDSQLKVKSFISEKQRPLVNKGSSVRVVSDMFPGKSFIGKVSFISDKADHSLNFPIEITITEKQEALKPGTFVTLYFGNDKMKNGILIPRRAIRGSVQAANVFVVKNGIARKQAVVTGNMLDENIEILQGLNPGDSIIVAGLINVSDGAVVKNIK
ncbi:MAG TPA: efflux RND transporter periplasmic adaptor subunit [Salinivirgaceae bacterium]|nr:efflux RND transporter periplasmic adaptor subunit [Salinivirgaceae bacterium]HQA76224.1 efflux RND transporter periplasmic adaptor subunit [Salinivirgaceae bacterium]